MVPPSPHLVRRYAHWPFHCLPTTPASGQALPGIQFDHHLLVDRQGDLLLGRKATNRSLERGLVEFQPAGDAPSIDRLERRSDRNEVTTSLTDFDLIAGLHN